MLPGLSGKEAAAEVEAAKRRSLARWVLAVSGLLRLLPVVMK